MIIKILVLAVIYFLTAKIGLQLDPIGGFATLVWPPSGISLAAVLLFGYSVLPGVFLGALLANFTSHAPLGVAMGIGLGNTLEAFFAAYLIKKFVDFEPSLERLKDVAALVLVGAFISTTLSASIGTLSLKLGGVIESSELWEAWGAWWLGDVLGDLVVAPLILVWFGRKISFKALGYWRYVEILVLVIGEVLLSLVVFRGILGFETVEFPITHLMFPLLIWMSLRLGQKASVTSIFIITLVAIWGTVEKLGPFGGEVLSENLFFLQIFVAVESVTFLVLSAVVAEREQLESLKDELSSAASHELRTPVTAIKGYLQLIDKQKLARGIKLRRYLVRIDDQVSRLTSLVHDLLDVTRAEAGKLELAPEYFSLDKIIKEIIADLGDTTKHRILYKGGSSDRIWADKYRVGQVVTNLLTNAIKFSPEDKKVEVKTRVDRDWVEISVKDFGIGIPERYQQEIFKKFFQTQHRLMSGSPGLGLGLYISAQIVKMHGGKMWVVSQEGKGSTFFMRLPNSALR